MLDCFRLIEYHGFYSQLGKDIGPPGEQQHRAVHPRLDAARVSVLVFIFASTARATVAFKEKYALSLIYSFLASSVQAELVES